MGRLGDSTPPGPSYGRGPLEAVGHVRSSVDASVWPDAHARTGLELTVRLQPSTLRVTVRDFSRGRPILFPVDTEAESGRGLLLVAAVAGSWQSEATADGKLVWCELSRAVAPIGGPRPDDR